MIELGLVVGIALLISLAKMPWPWKLRILSNPLFIDLIIFALLVFLHWGTYSGVMVATIGALTCSCVLWTGKYLLGHLEHGVYVPGRINIAHKLA